MVGIALLLTNSSNFAQSAATDPKTAIEWAQLSYDHMSLRVPGESPFHMKVSFHAYPGNEFLGQNEKPQIITGVGTYEETWNAPHEWRREVTLGGYHAVEVESEKGRKIQASSDYEPSRVLMLMMALLSPEAPDIAVVRPRKTEIKHIRLGDASIVRISMNDSPLEDSSVDDATYYLPGGVLFLNNISGVVTSWENDEIFAGKVVPRRIAVKAVDRPLLTADVTVEAAGSVEPGVFDLPVEPAKPGNTLRPIRRGYKTPRTLSGELFWPDNGGGAVSLFGVLDRTGRLRDIEVISSVNARDVQKVVDSFRKARSSPAELDGSPCEIPVYPLAMEPQSQIHSTLQ